MSGNERDDGLNQPATPIVYWPLLNESYQLAHDGLRRAIDARRRAGFVRELQQAVWSVNPNLPLAAVQTARRDSGAARWRRRPSPW